MTRFDAETPQRESWSLSTDFGTSFVPGSEIGWRKKAMQHKKLFARITPYGESPVSAPFDITHLAQAIKPLRKACHW
jgi:type VI secretion system protein VasI